MSCQTALFPATNCFGRVGGAVCFCWEFFAKRNSEHKQTARLSQVVVQ